MVVILEHFSQHFNTEYQVQYSSKTFEIQNKVTNIIDNMLVQPDAFIVFMIFIFTKLVVRKAFELPVVQTIIWGEKVN